MLTGYAAVLASALEAALLLWGPFRVPGALTYTDVLTERLQVLDATAVSLCMENNLPIIVFNLNTKDNIRNAALGEPVGTLISGGANA